MKLKILISIFFSATFGFSQTDSLDLSMFGYPKKGLYRETGPLFARREKSIGLVPEVNIISNHSFGIGLSRANFSYGEGIGIGYGVNVGLHYSPTEKLAIPYVSVWGSVNSFGIFGLYGGLKSLYYTNGHSGNFALRPEIGFGIVKINVFYGYTMFASPLKEQISKHSLNVSYYQIIYPRKKSKTRKR